MTARPHFFTRRTLLLLSQRPEPRPTRLQYRGAVTGRCNYSPTTSEGKAYLLDWYAKPGRYSGD